MRGGVFFCSKTGRVFPRFPISSEYTCNANVYQAAKESCRVTDRLFGELPDGSFTCGWSITCRCYRCPWQAETLSGCATHDAEPLQRSRTSSEARCHGRQTSTRDDAPSPAGPQGTPGLARLHLKGWTLAKTPRSLSALGARSAVGVNQLHSTNANQPLLSNHGSSER